MAACKQKYAQTHWHTNKNYEYTYWHTNKNIHRQIKILANMPAYKGQYVQTCQNTHNNMHRYAGIQLKI